ncbi:ribbon-helix-helix domain-containing protein [Alterinioella nitratireducens]|uniref:ribbon-helix-helix domain-containing protein n=1 Tax=Alterinioella nitratireducens TaxID=2735915 RepID=UPI0015535E55|nr:ribbon-helix-helix domain-containing protein [Alterinioella nitratireducens]NPD19149.1 ribbon-helix-helix domain-containing protein [Alterinioella nitratireducens]
MTARPVKRSLTLRGHRTSVSLEEAFWQEFRAIADEKHLSINELAALVDVERGVESGLASAIRVYILREVKARRTPVSDAPSS